MDGHLLKKRIYKKSFSTSQMCYYLLRQKKKTFMVCANVNKIFKYRDAYTRLINFIVKL